MPANPNSPFGFRFVKMIEPQSANFGVRTGLIASGNLNKIFTGDVLAPPSAGYYDRAAVTGGGAAIGGIADWFEWVSISELRTVRKKWWPGNGDASGDVTVAFVSAREAVFEAQCLLGPTVQADVGKGANFNIGSGGVQIGAGNQSSYTLDDSTKNATLGNLPFRIFSLPVFGPTAALYSQPGYDASQTYNRVWVTMINLTPN